MRLADRLVDLTCLFRLFNLLRELLRDGDDLVLYISLKLFLFLFKSMAELEVFLESDVELAAQIFDILRSLVMLHVPEVRDLAWRHRRQLPIASGMLPTRKVLLLDQVAGLRVMPAPEHRRVVLVCCRLRLWLLAVSANHGETLLVWHVPLACLRAVLPQRMLIVLVRAVRVGVQVELRRELLVLDASTAPFIARVFLVLAARVIERSENGVRLVRLQLEPEAERFWSVLAVNGGNKCLRMEKSLEACSTG